IGNYGRGGNGRLTILNSTLSYNRADTGGAILNDGGSVGILNSTLANSYGGILAKLSGGAGVIGSSTFGNTYGRSIYFYPGSTVTSLGFNLSADNGSGFLTNATDIIETNLMLGPLQDNGGPTFTHAPQPGSPAIDNGTNFSASATDQRGLP